MIREATHDDLAPLVVMGSKFAMEAGFDFDVQSIAETIAALIDNPDGVVFIAEGGTAGAILYPRYFNRSHITAQEMFWWIDPAKRGEGVGRAMLDALEDWARSAGAQSITMLALENVEPEKAGAMYRRRGYRPLEYSYVRQF